MQSIHSILKTYWGYNNFRPLQEDIIQTILGGTDTLALLPTGGGKSICFQVPALAMDGLCLVISPLIALMKDQVQNLRKKNITAFAIYSGMSRAEVHQTLKTAAESNCKFLYVSPERLETKLFQEYLPSLGVALIAVDEAHCISQWGYDFRPPYLRIAALREELPGIPVLALTASATEEVQGDICEKLAFRKHKVFRQSFERPNLSYSAFKVDSRINKVVDILTKVNGTGIVYCKSRKKTKQISDLLQMQGISADFYHAGLTQDQRNAKQEAWIDNRTRVIVCTNAFGMGIDKPEVRVVIHADVPDCLENYYQEAGRAGRDGKKSYAVLLYNDRDAEELIEQVEVRFPAMTEIRNVYRHLMNYLQIPAGTGEGNYFEFDLQSFLKLTKLNSRLVIATLKALEQEQLVVVNEQVFIPSRIEFTAERDQLEEMERNNPDLDRMVKILLRTYEGIFDQPVSISENAIARQVKKNAEFVKSQLSLLSSARIINYQPQKELPQIYFIENRVAADDLYIDPINFKKRKEVYKQRIETMRDFLYVSKCRSQFIAEYFGDMDTKECGICDSCLAAKRKPVSSEEFEQIYSNIIHSLKQRKYSRNQLLGEQLQKFQKQKILEVLSFLQAENKISISTLGEITLIAD